MTLRMRLAAWSAGMLAVTLVIFSLTVYTAVQATLQSNLDQVIWQQADHLVWRVPLAASPPYLVARHVQSSIDMGAPNGSYLQVLDLAGSVIARSRSLGAAVLPLPGPLALAAPRATASGGLAIQSDPPDQSNVRLLLARIEKHQPYPAYTATVASGTLRLLILPLYTPQRHLAGFLITARSLESMMLALSTLAIALPAVGVAALLLTAAATFFLARRALRPIAAITETAHAVALSQNFSQRLADSGARDEVSHLARTFNEMLSSLEGAYAVQKRFVADASHELRAPLTSILGNAEALARAPDAPASDRAEALTDIIDESRRLSRLVANLLALARADAGQALARQDVWLDTLLLETVERLSAVHPQAALRLGEIEPTCVCGDADRLKELIVILLDNALKYAPPHSPVTCTVRREGASACLTVADHGIGISPTDLPHIFERFYRADKARSRDEAGVGLGLSIAAWIVEQHHGRIDVRSTEGSGSIFTVTLPARPGATF